MEVRCGAALGGAAGVAATVVAGRGGAALLSVPSMVDRFGSLAIDLGCRLSCLAFWRVRRPAAASGGGCCLLLHVHVVGPVCHAEVPAAVSLYW